MRALVAHGSKRGGTAGLAEMVAAALERRGVEATTMSAGKRPSVDGFDVVIVGGALYANRWHRDAARFLRRRGADLASKQVWLFSSGPLGDEDAADAAQIPPVTQVERLMNSTGARGHRTFGGCLGSDATGFPASVMARTLAGDWRDQGDVERWVGEIVEEMKKLEDREVER